MPLQLVYIYNDYCTDNPNIGFILKDKTGSATGEVFQISTPFGLSDVFEDVYIEEQFKRISLKELKKLNQVLYQSIMPISKYLTSQDSLLRQFVKENQE